MTNTPSNQAEVGVLMPFITANYENPNYYVKVQVRTNTDLHVAHDIVLKAFAPSPQVDRGVSTEEGWRDISEAPKNGTHLLVKFEGTMSPPTVAHWFGAPDDGGWYLSVQQHEGPAIHPTHWMLVPEQDVYDKFHRLALKEIEWHMARGTTGEVERLAALVDAFECFRFPALSPVPSIHPLRDREGGDDPFLLAEMAKNLGWELDWGPRDRDDEESDFGWRVYDRSGNRSDLEWTLVGFGDTPSQALKAALSPSKPGAGT